MSTNDHSESHTIPKLLVIETHFTFEMIRARRLEATITSRDLNGYFSDVVTVHPFATLLTSPSWTSRFGRPVEHKVNKIHTFVEGKVGRFQWMSAFGFFNFILSQIGLWFFLRKLIQKRAISLIRVSDAHYVGLLGLLLARRSGIPLLVRVGANYDFNRVASGRPMQPRLLKSIRVEKALERFVLKRADMVAGANQDNLEFALRNGARPESSTIFRYGNLLDPAHFIEPRFREMPSADLSEFDLEPGKFTLTVGRLETIKQPADIVYMLAKLHRSGHPIKTVIAGDGRLHGDLEALARSMDVGDYLVLAGNRDQAWLSTMYPQAAMLISPHAGRALSEAALAAVPVVAYDIDWQGELIETDRTGILVPNRDVDAAVAGAKRIFNDWDYGQRMGIALRARALDMLDPVRLDAHERATYDRLLGRLTE